MLAECRTLRLVLWLPEPPEPPSFTCSPTQSWFAAGPPAWCSLTGIRSETNQTSTPARSWLRNPVRARAAGSDLSREPAAVDLSWLAQTGAANGRWGWRGQAAPAGLRSAREQPARR